MNDFINKKQLAEKLNLSTRTIDNMVLAKKIPFMKLSPRMIRFDLGKVMTALQRFTIHEVGGPAPHHTKFK